MVLLTSLKSQTKLATWRVVVRTLKVAVVGAGGGIGQPLSLLLRRCPGIDELALHDISDMKGIAADLSHVSQTGKVLGFSGEQELEPAVSGADVVVVAAGMPRLPGMQRDHLMAANGNVAVKVATAVSNASPRALLAFITNPVNMIVPTAAEVLKAYGTFDPRRLFGVTTLDVVRSKKFIGDSMNISPDEVNIPVIGGHAGITILPLISQCQPRYRCDPQEIHKLTHRIQEAGTEVVNAKAGNGSATLSMAFAGATFVDSLLRGIRGQEGLVECAFVASELTDAPFFASPLELGKDGIKGYIPLPQMSDYEKEALEKLLPVLRQNADEGVNFARTFLKAQSQSPLPAALP
ncbi:malate dehydrogenase, mitochondrial [Drosophila teissieri]|uniref:malate dehydrogenase, mitochondrial n=1 Tax=Drosophila teissieri TaxID=7243 RepID=UPI001CB9E5D1|nr:malate dehydrogenase, mitochondrial [Drosophila teissieri]